jgi:aspartate/tyrosine/aromatic aminotransferase
MRQKLYQMFLDLKTPGDWSHVVAQTGMFSYLGISTAQVMYLRGVSCLWDGSTDFLLMISVANYHIYMSETSRIAITGLHDGNLAYFAQAVDRAVRDISDI